MSAFPEPFTVGLHVFTPSGTNSWNDAEPAWADPVSRNAYGWAPVSATGAGETYDAGRNATEVDLQVFGSSAALGDVTARDRMTVDGQLYDVIGSAENYNFGPFGFAPGVRINLKRVEG